MTELDLTYLESVTDGDNELIQDLLEIFFSQVPEYNEEFKVAFENKDSETLGRIAHKAKSSIAIMGLNDLATQLSKFEAEAGAGVFSENYMEYIKLFETECNDAIRLLKEKFDL